MKKFPKLTHAESYDYEHISEEGVPKL